MVLFLVGTLGLNIHHYEWKPAVRGENISLPCIVEEQDITNKYYQQINIIQMEWIKRQQGVDMKIAVFHPNYPIRYFKNASIVERKNSSTGKLQGSILNLFEVTVNDSGNYICEITSYPHGSIRIKTEVKITGKHITVIWYLWIVCIDHSLYTASVCLLQSFQYHWRCFIHMDL